MMSYRMCYESTSKMPSVDKSDVKDAASDDRAENIW